MLQGNPEVRRHAFTAEEYRAEVSDGRWFVSAQNPVRLSGRDEPQPDLSLLGQRPRPNAPAPPGPEDVLLVIEVLG